MCVRRVWVSDERYRKIKNTEVFPEELISIPHAYPTNPSYSAVTAFAPGRGEIAE